MTNILWITENFPPGTGGVQSYLFNTITNMHGHRSIVVCQDYTEKNCSAMDESIKCKGNKIVRVNCIPKNEGIVSLVKHLDKVFKICNIINKIIRTEKISVIMFGHNNFFNLVILLIMSLIRKTPMAIVFHGEDIPVINMKSNACMRWMLSRARFHVCNSDFTYNRLIHFRSSTKPTYVAYPGVEDAFFATVDNSRLRSKYRANNKKIIITVGRIDKRKGHELVINALPAIINTVPDVLYLIAGTGAHSDFLKKKVFDLRLQDNVVFCGFIPDGDIAAFHQLADVFVMPNRVLDDGDTEGFGIVFLEANASGKPVIGGACGGALDAIEDGRSGYLVDPMDVDGLTEKIVYLLSNPEVAEQMGKYGRQRAWEYFRWPYLAGKFEAFLEDLAL
jgi:phosphatidyl-myo-inositol dimannoside synthase